MIHLVAVMLILASLDQAKSDPKVSGWDDEDWLDPTIQTTNYGDGTYYNQSASILDSTEVQFKTDSLLGSNDLIYIVFANERWEMTGKLILKFEERMVINPYDCVANPEFSATLPSENEKIWTVSFNDELRLTIDVNGVIVYNFLMSECTVSYWNEVWKKGSVSIDIDTDDSKDIILDGYRAKPKVSGWDDEDWIAADTITKNDGSGDYYNQTGNVDSAGIQFKTDSVLGSEDHISVIFLNKDDEETGMFYIQFKDAMIIHPNGCLATGTAKLSAAIPSENEKIWTVSFNDELRLTIDVNGVILYNFLMSECTSQSWANNWKKGTVSIDIGSRDSEDIVLDGYRAFQKDDPKDDGSGKEIDEDDTNSEDDDTMTNNEDNHNFSDAGYSMTISTILFGTLLFAINMIY
ncbi:uncharacterized protein LOC134819455 [Bolinopsis microptera]|uniref:uncharacterized protein LOC134819455 n=1 Tax=Bolinopsis microptera TaxID=2820187 RepID=UPI003079667D